MNWPFYFDRKDYTKRMEYTFSSLQQEIMDKLKELDKDGFFG